jgi:5-formyltetrahydrofolate cyclo-ligase
MTANEKKTLRREFMIRRKNLAPDRAKALSDAICGRIRALDAWPRVWEMMAYMAVGGEVDVFPLVEEVWRSGGRVLLPRCRPGKPGLMDVACPAGVEELAPGSYGIPEPLPGKCPSLAECYPDLVLVPGVAFDRSGKRLGMGGGYYDRLLGSGMLGGPLLVSPAYSFQITDNIPSDPWDKTVDVIVTEEKTIWT